MTFADQQRIFEERQIVPKRVATFLKLAARKQCFHPVVVPGNVIEPCSLRGSQGFLHPASERSTIPPHTGDEAAECIGEDIKQVADRPGKDHWPQ